MKRTKIFLTLFFMYLLLVCMAYGQMGMNYPIKHSNNILIDKNFYFITVLSRDKQACEALQKNKVLSAYLDNQKQQIKVHSTDTCMTPVSLLNDFKWQTDTTALCEVLGNIYEANKNVFDAIIDKELRPSGCYILFNTRSNKEYFLSCWKETFKGVNTIINHYGLNKGFRYPSIDSASYDVNGTYYTHYLKGYLLYQAGAVKGLKLFYQPSLEIALALMQKNGRTEPANYEPLGNGENKQAVVQVGRTKFENYTYSVILVPGQGPEIAGVAIDPIGKQRCDLAAISYKQKLSPFIIVSGGNVHPFHTPYTEALEMKKYLMEHDSIPESAIIIEPQARHTTTNFRNAARLMIRYGIPIDKKALCVSSEDQVAYILNGNFDKRNIREMGYVPYTGKEKLSGTGVVFYPVRDCLQIDPIDPLDP